MQKYHSKLKRSPKMTSSLIMAINDLLYVQAAESIKGKIVQVVGTTIRMPDIAEKLAHLPLSSAHSVVISGGYKKIGLIEKLAGRAFAKWNDIVHYGVADKYIVAEEKRPESRRIFDHFKKHYPKEWAEWGHSDAARRSFLEKMSTNTPQNFSDPQGFKIYERLGVKKIVIVAGSETALRTKLTAQTILGKDFEIEVMPYESRQPYTYNPAPAAFSRDFRHEWTRHINSRRFIWSEVMALVRYGDWEYGDKTSPFKIKLDEETKSKLRRIISMTNVR